MLHLVKYKFIKLSISLIILYSDSRDNTTDLDHASVLDGKSRPHLTLLLLLLHHLLLLLLLLHLHPLLHHVLRLHLLRLARHPLNHHGGASRSR